MLGLKLNYVSKRGYWYQLNHAIKQGPIVIRTNQMEVDTWILGPEHDLTQFLPAPWDPR